MYEVRKAEGCATRPHCTRLLRFALFLRLRTTITLSEYKRPLLQPFFFVQRTLDLYDGTDRRQLCLRNAEGTENVHEVSGRSGLEVALNTSGDAEAGWLSYCHAHSNDQGLNSLSRCSQRRQKCDRQAPCT
jgi:hypothetical protein